MCKRGEMPDLEEKGETSTGSDLFLLIENGEVLDPDSIGGRNVFIAGDKIAKLDDVDPAALAQAGIECDVIDAKGCYVVPGLIDPHQHLLGGSGERGFSSQTPEITLSEIIRAGITSVVGCLGADTTMKTMAGLLAKAKGLKEQGMNAFIWSGGYATPPATITGNACDDVMFIDEVIGVGEIAIADVRGSEPTVHEIARLASDAHKGGMLSRKAGVCHFHVGEGDSRLQVLRDVIEKHEVNAEWLYPTHIQRSEELMLEAIDLAKNGSFVDIDTVDEDLAKWLRFYLDNNGWLEKLTVSSDASKSSPSNLLDQLRNCVLEHKFPISQVLRIATSNTARALSIDHFKGRIAEGYLADIIVIDKETLELREVISAGRRLMKDGRVSVEEEAMKDSNRTIRLGPAANGKQTAVHAGAPNEITTRLPVENGGSMALNGDQGRFHECYTDERRNDPRMMRSYWHLPKARKRTSARGVI